MIKNISGLLLFEEERNIISSIRILAQKYVDNGAHPRDFKNGKLKTEISIEYNRRKIIEITELIKNMKSNDILRLKHYLNIRNKSNNIQNILESIKTHSRIEKLLKFILQLSKAKKEVKITKSKTGKISMKMGPSRRTRKKSR